MLDIHIFTYKKNRFMLFDGGMYYGSFWIVSFIFSSLKWKRGVLRIDQAFSFQFLDFGINE